MRKVGWRHFRGGSEVRKGFPSLMFVIRTILRRCVCLARVFGSKLGFGAARSDSTNYAVVEGDVGPELLEGWRTRAVAGRQWAAFAPLLKQLHAGYPREDFVALAAAVKATCADDPLVVEVGCGSGWNSEVMTTLLGRWIRYVGIDYAPAMLSHGKRHYPDLPFVAGDASYLPLCDGACDILLSGTVLMHVLGYREAIMESRRVTRQWAILHTVPVMQTRPTTVLSKEAYGQPIVEIIFNEGELLALLSQAGLAVVEVFDSIPYDLRAEIGEATSTKTFLCRVHSDVAVE